MAELSEGFGSALANDQVTFMILEGGLISIACIVLTVLHAGPAFKTTWNTANFKLRKPDAAKMLRQENISDGSEPVGFKTARKAQEVYIL